MYVDVFSHENVTSKPKINEKPTKKRCHVPCTFPRNHVLVIKEEKMKVCPGSNAEIG